MKFQKLSKLPMPFQMQASSEFNDDSIFEKYMENTNSLFNNIERTG